MKKGSSADNPVLYDISSGRWFAVAFRSDQRSRKLVIYSGVVDHNQSDGTIIYCDQDSNEKLILPHPPGYDTNGDGPVSCCLIGDILLIQSPYNSETKTSFLDLVRFHNNEMFHFKRISIKQRTSLDTSFFLDNSSSMVYMFKKLECRKRLQSGFPRSGIRLKLTVFDYSGNPILEKKAVDPGDDFTMNCFIYIRKSFFLALLRSATSHQKVLKTFNATQSGITILKTVDVSTYHFMLNSMHLHKKSLYRVDYFNQVLVCAVFREAKGRYGVCSFNTATGEQKVLYRGSENEQIYHFDFNWDLSEIAVWIFVYADRTMHLKIVKLPNQDISLKHFARLTCLRSFGERYLKERLPACLRKYLGILKE